MTYADKASQTTEGLYHMCYRFQLFNRKYYDKIPVICRDTCLSLFPNSNVQCHLMTFLDRLSLYHSCSHKHYFLSTFPKTSPTLSFSPETLTPPC